MNPESPDVSPWITAPAGVVFLLLLAGGAFYLHERKRRVLQAFAEAHNLNYFDNEDVEAVVPSHFEFHEQGRMGSVPGQFRVHLTGERDGAEVTLGEYCYTNPDNGGAHGYPVWLVMVSDSRIDFPHFTLRPEKWRYKLSDPLNEEDIDFNDSPEFSSKFQLKSDDAEKVRSVFTEDVRAFFAERRGCCCEGDGDTFIFFHPPRMLRSTRFSRKRAERLLEDANDLSALFCMA